MWYITTYMLTEFKNCASKIFKRKRYTTNKPCSSKIQLKFLSTIFYYFSIWKYFKIPFFIDSCRKGEECMPCHKDTTQQTHHVYSTLKPRRNDCFHVVSTWDTRGVFVGLSNVAGNALIFTLLSNFFEIALWHGCSLGNMLHIFRIPFPKNTSGWLLLISREIWDTLS